MMGPSNFVCNQSSLADEGEFRQKLMEEFRDVTSVSYG